MRHHACSTMSPACIPVPPSLANEAKAGQPTIQAARHRRPLCQWAQPVFEMITTARLATLAHCPRH